MDAKLIELASRRHAGIITDDFNLNRVAHLHDVRILNMNHLANAVKPAFLPGDGLKVKVIQEGKEPGQGLAYLDDGTMIVVEGGGQMIEREVDVTRRARAADGRRTDGLRPAKKLRASPGACGRRLRVVTQPPRADSLHRPAITFGGFRFADAVIVAAGASTRMGGVDKLTPQDGADLLGRPCCVVGRGDARRRVRERSSSSLVASASPSWRLSRLAQRRRRRCRRRSSFRLRSRRRRGRERSVSCSSMTARGRSRQQPG